MTANEARRLVLFGVLVFFGVLVALLFLWEIRAVVVVAFLALMLSAAMRRPAARLSRFFGWGPSVVLLYLMLLLAGLSLVLVFVPTVLVETLAFLDSLPLYAEQGRVLLSAAQQLASDLGLATGFQLPTEQLAAFATGLIQQALFLPLNLLTAAAALFSIFALSLYFLLDREHLVSLVTSFLPRERRGRALDLLAKVEDGLGAYVWGQFMVSVAIGVLTLLGLLLLDVKFALLLALFAAIMEVVPTIGPFIAGVPAVLVALSQSFWLAVVVVVMYVVIQELEAYVIAPKIQEAAVHLSPFLILLAVLIGGSLYGIIGALVAVPLAVTLGVLLEEVKRSMVQPEEETVVASPTASAGQEQGTSFSAEKDSE